MSDFARRLGIAFVVAALGIAFAWAAFDRAEDAGSSVRTPPLREAAAAIPADSRSDPDVRSFDEAPPHPEDAPARGMEPPAGEAEKKSPVDERPFDDDVVIEIGESHMDTEGNYNVVIRRDGKATLTTEDGLTRRKSLTQEEIERVVAVFRRHGFENTRSTYDEPQYTDAGYFHLSLNYGGLRKRTRGDWSDPGTKDVHSIVSDVGALLLFESWRQSHLDPPLAPESRR